jgi:hypothetical protein
MTGRIYYDTDSDPYNPGWVAKVDDAPMAPTWQIDDDEPEEMIAEAIRESNFYCGEEVTEWTVDE